jgi:hypothetical protein
LKSKCGFTSLKSGIGFSSSKRIYQFEIWNGIYPLVFRMFENLVNEDGEAVVVAKVSVTKPRFYLQAKLLKEPVLRLRVMYNASGGHIKNRPQA